MVTDDVNSPQNDPLRRTPLAHLLAASGGGLDIDRVVKWARQLAREIDELHDRGGYHGCIEPEYVVVDVHDRAHLHHGMAERNLLLGDDAGPRAIADDVRGLAATVYEALAGRPPDAEAAPIAGVSVQVNMALLAVLDRRRGAPPGRAGDFAAHLEATADGVAVPATRPTPARSRRSAPPALSITAAAFAVVATSLAAWLWLVPRGVPGPGSEPAMAAVFEQTPLARRQPVAAGPDVADELALVDRDIKAAAAQRARRRWHALVAEQPEVIFDRARPELARIATSVESAETLLVGEEYTRARALFEQATESLAAVFDEHREALHAATESGRQWQSALEASPDHWSDDLAVQLACTDSLALAEEAEQARLAGRFDLARRGFQDATELWREALILGDRRAVTLAAQLDRSREEGRYEDSLGVIDELAVYRDPAEIKARRIETYLAWARARDSRATRAEARRALDGLLALDPRHPAGLALRAAMAVHWRARSGDLMVNSLSQTLVLVDPGTFEMGSPRTELFHQRSERQHTVQLTRGFWIGRIEVTRGQFARFVADTGHVTDAEETGWSLGFGPEGSWMRADGVSWRDPGVPQTDNHPVVCVSWRDATAFCRWLSVVESRVYRLPTEAQWEYACRAGADGAFTWGNDPYPDTARINGADETWMGRYPDTVGFPWYDQYMYTSPVASFPANAWGLFDMHGNVREWCADVYGPYRSGQAIDPTGPPGAVDDPAPRVLRGGSFASLPAHCRAAHRDASRPDSSFVATGFRIVLEQ
ncbi:MAG: SUMF1/EgtB/PvdO family nonheme iron enzyme [Planctomycetes bacterium]|nr:SUMF1/EgtB/PvdO family nonheme iron enzyme [Planctomycetota bacterium]